MVTLSSHTPGLPCTSRAREATARARLGVAYQAYIEAIYGAGVAYAGSGLQNATTTATTVRLVEGERHIQDGPFVDTKEQLAGFFLIEVADLDKALEWAARCPSIARGGIVEVRPALEQG